jgi:hypothetical protein
LAFNEGMRFFGIPFLSVDVVALSARSVSAGLCGSAPGSPGVVNVQDLASVNVHHLVAVAIAFEQLTRCAASRPDCAYLPGLCE